MNKKNNNLIERPPVIVIMGHIDHGKSTLLDFIRKTNIVEGEAGSITQHISAYEVIHKEKKITFIDTPGHAAFCNVRSTGACIADIAVLIISAEDGVKPQTIEAYKSIQEAKLPFIIAINKIDKPNANVEKVKQELMEKEIFLEGSGGNISFAEISAKTGAGVPELIDTLLLMAEMEELKADKSNPASGFILESKVDTQKGTEVVVVIKNGTIKKGNFVLINNKVSPVRRLENFLGDLIEEATFSSPVRLTGLRGIPEAGAEFKTYLTKKEAEKNIVEVETEEINTRRVPSNNKKNTDILIMIKTDVFGTIDAIKQEINKIEQERANIRIVVAEVGDINENDIKMAGTKGDTLIVGFNVKASQHIKDLAERQGVKIVIVDVIYKLTEWLEENIKNLVPKIKVEETTGLAKVIRVFSQTKSNHIIGGEVKEGKLALSSEVKILRRDNEIGRGIIMNVQSQKIQTKEVSEGDKFGMDIKSKIEIISDDVLEAFKIVEK